MARSSSMDDRKSKREKDIQNYAWSIPEVAAATSRSEWDTMDEGRAKETENGTEIFKQLFSARHVS